MIVFIDTSAFFALLDREDANNRKAKTILDKILIPQNTLITSNYVLVESFSLLQHRLGLQAVREFHEDMLPLINIEWVNKSTHQSGVSALLAASRRKLSLVDCVSFEVMRNMGIKKVFTFDPHFEEQGFVIIS
ncbi:MAG: twitching motility protein PilT [Nitrospirae bacterium GWF2_44_13]|nr:MAG: twitching motility protein PilT [Nitrospirae bacterium GWF2_44_13]OGW65857.1 MAG: twitching motility protein PilT [Nitrospirae bacterium RIFOXYA2_FULL_44_9]OGW70497.1 MAG: twitching motility protein PilT [Nitrospirae bacterium RIFOXYC2_FULL_44_7]HBG93282.1 VapC toxin family PIN domain ribonuclease [Nitrospiraceae bacterium]